VTKDNFTAFFEAYIDNFIPISEKIKIMEGEDPSSLNVCGDVANYIKVLLSKGKPIILKPASDTIATVTFMKRYLKLNKLLLVNQEISGGGQEHWFAVIGDMPNVHIIEYTKEVCNLSETMSLDDFLDQMIDILWGYEPDRFYGESKRHTFGVAAFVRKPLSKKTVMDFLGSKPEVKKIPLVSGPKTKLTIKIKSKEPEAPEKRTFEESIIPPESPRIGSRKLKKGLTDFEKFRSEIIKNMELNPEDYESNLMLLDLFNNRDSDVAKETLAASRNIARLRKEEEKAARADKAYYKKEIKEKRIKTKEAEYEEDYMDAEELEQSLLPPVRRGLVDISQVQRAPVGISGFSRSSRSKPQESVRLDLRPKHKGESLKIDLREPASVTTATMSTSASRTLNPNFKGYGHPKKGLMWR